MTNTNVIETLKNAIVTRTTEQAGVIKTKEVQQALKSNNFSNRRVFAKYNYLCNLFIIDMQKVLNADANAEKSISKSTLLKKLQDVSDFLQFESVKIENKAITFKNYHVNFILNHALTLKIQSDKSYTDTIKSETAIKKLIEGCFYFTLNNLPLPSVQISEKSQERINKNALIVAEQEQNDGNVKTPKTDKKDTQKENAA